MGIYGFLFCFKSTREVTTMRSHVEQARARPRDIDTLLQTSIVFKLTY